MDRRVNFTTLLKCSGIYCTQAFLWASYLKKRYPLTVKCYKTAKNSTWCFLSDILYHASFYKTACKLLNHKAHLIKIASSRDSCDRWVCESKHRVMEESNPVGSLLSLSSFSNLHQPNRFVLNEARFCIDFLKSQSPAQCA